MSHLNSQFYFQRISRALPNISDLQLSAFVLDFFFSNPVKVEVKNVFSFEIIYLHVDQEKLVIVMGHFAEI